MLQKFKQIKWKSVLTVLKRVIFWVSLLVNVVLWYNKTDLEKRIRFADYNDRAWSALSSFELQYKKLEEDISLKLDSLFISNDDTIDFLTTIQNLNEQWETHLIRLIKEISSRIRGYEHALVSRPSFEVIEILDQLIRSFKPPSTKAKQLIYQRTSEVKRMVRNLPPLSPEPMFPPNKSEILISRTGEKKLVLHEELKTALVKRRNWLDNLAGGLDYLSNESIEAVRKTWSVQEKSLQK